MNITFLLIGFGVVLVIVFGVWIWKSITKILENKKKVNTSVYFLLFAFFVSSAILGGGLFSLIY
ncbi:hypothetical protein M2135_002802 [Parabacteroides sp. PF5-9]|nr:hypothetical protein [Parabacteroides sp. PF5-9]